MVDRPAILSLVSLNPQTPNAETDPDAWAMAVAREIMVLYRAHGRTPILVWPDPDNPGVSVVGKKRPVDVKSQTGINSQPIE